MSRDYLDDPAFDAALREAARLDAAGDELGAVAVLREYHARRRALLAASGDVKAQAEAEANDPPDWYLDADKPWLRLDHIDLLATGPMGGQETPEEEAAADAALDALGARWRAEIVAGGDPFQAHLLPDPDDDDDED